MSPADDVPADLVGPASAGSEPALDDDVAVADPVDSEVDETGEGDAGDNGDQSDEPMSVEALLDDLVKVAAERDGHLSDLQRVSADFANYRKRVDERHAAQVAQAESRLVDKLLPTLDACDAAVIHGAEDVEPIRAALLDTLTGEGLERIHEPGEPFDPNRHDAVMAEEGDGDGDQVVAEVLRTGYVWNGRVLRPAMVKVRG